MTATHCLSALGAVYVARLDPVLRDREQQVQEEAGQVGVSLWRWLLRSTGKTGLGKAEGTYSETPSTFFRGKRL